MDAYYEVYMMFLDTMWTSNKLNQQTIMATSPLKEHNRDRKVESKDYSNIYLE